MTDDTPELKHIRYGNLEVHYFVDVGTGGMDFGQDFVPIVRKLFGRVNSICDFAGGNGFIGFSLLSNGLCDKLCIIDKNPKAILACDKTVADNNLSEKVSTYTSDIFSNVPENEKWDLIVGNLPHFNGSKEQYSKDMKSVDPAWEIHRRFYRDAPKHLKSGGFILLVEDYQASAPAFFNNMISTVKELKFEKTFRFGLFRRVNKNLAENLKAQQVPLSVIIRLGVKRLFNPFNQFYFVLSRKNG